MSSTSTTKRMYQIDFRDKAKEDTDTGFCYYESRRPGLGFDFLHEVELFLEKLKQNPFAYSYFDEPYRQGKIARFPYLIIFEIQEETVVVFRVFDGRQDPSQKLSA